MKTTSTSPAARIAALAAAMALLAATARAETVSIASASDWAAFAGRVNTGETSLGAKMAADVTLTQDSPFVGDGDSHPYSGTFDGDGHKLTVNWRFTDGTQWVAPFRFAKGCTIRNLHVAGSLESNGKFVAGFIGQCLRDDSAIYSQIEQCRSSVTITCTISGDATSAGFVGHVQDSGNAKVRLADCLFDGSLLGPTANCCGGFTGYRPYYSYARYYNCLFDPEDVTISDYNSYTFSRGGWDTLENCFYTQAYGDTQGGTDASAMSASDLAAKLGSAWTVSGGKAVLSLFPYAAGAPSPDAVAGFAYQGALKNVSGLPMTGQQTVQFRLYDAATGGSPLWGRSHSVLLDTNGLFNAELSDTAGDELEGVNGINLSAILSRNSATPLYVGVTVAGADGEIAPRQRILSVPYASFAADSGAASGDFAATGKLAAGGLGVTGRADIAGKATVKGDASVGGKLAVSGKILGPGSRPAYGTAPVGAIVLWSGSANRIPDGWALCDGQGGTPDLRGKFVVGYDPNDGDYNAPGRTGGETRHTLTADEMASHNHSYFFRGADLKLGWDSDNYFYDGSNHYDSNGNSRSTDYTGGGQSHENRPPYYALCYIMRVK